VPEALQVCIQICHALELAHERGIIHRDVKPGNVMIGARGLVKVLDFGLARRLVGIKDDAPSPPEPAAPEESVQVLSTFRLAPDLSADEDAPTIAVPLLAEDGTVSLTGWTVGTPGYMSPEQVMSEAVDARADIFAFACVLYECLTGRRAFRGKTPIEIMRSTLDDEPDLKRLPPRTHERVRDVLMACFRKHAADRPAELRLVRFELEEALGIRRASALREGEAYTAPNNLPAQPTSFVGRAVLLEDCGKALDRARILTLAGLGGSGKTRLAVQLAQLRLDAFVDGTWFVDIAPLLEPERVPEALAAVLGVREEPGRPLLDGIGQALAEKRALVLLDNCETQLEACAELVGHLTRSSRELKVLLTSREPLGVEGEVVSTVPALQVPAATADPATALTSEAVKLFVERATIANPAFALTRENVSAVVEVCTRLDGLPLALELAAARVKMLSVEQIRARLDDRFKLLTRSAGGSSRQQTVHDTIAWSFEHLLEPEQDLFWRLAVFTGGWTLERAVEICSDSGDEFEMLDLLTRLAERALVVVQREGEQVVRYRYLESVWRFALDRAAEHAEFEAVRERHVDVFTRFTEATERALAGADAKKSFLEAEVEEGNVLAAFEWCRRSPARAEQAMRLASSAQRYWSIAGRFGAGLRALDDALALDVERRPTAMRVRALTRRAGFLLTLGDDASARVSLEEALGISRALGDRVGVARVLAGLGVVALSQDDPEAAATYSQESAALYRELDQSRGVAMALHNAGTAMQMLGRHRDALEQAQSAGVLLDAMGDRVTVILVLSVMATLHLALGETSAALPLLQRAIEELSVFQVPREGVSALEAVARWALATGHAPESARLSGAVRALRDAYGVKFMAFESRDFEALRAEIGGAIGAELMAAEEAAGMTWPLPEAIARAREVMQAS
jgi:non-specific serine/threonine protein kinase